MKSSRIGSGNPIFLLQRIIPRKKILTVVEEHRPESQLKGSVRYARVIPLGGVRTLSIEWAEEYFMGTKTAEEVTFSMEARMRRILLEAGIIK